MSLEQTPAITSHKKGISPTTYVLHQGGNDSLVEGAVIEEALACISVNGQELSTFMCTPYDLDELALGFLRSEGFIQSMADIEVLTISTSKTCVDIWLKDLSFNPPTRRIITSGCGGGITFDDLTQRHPPLNTHITINPQQVTALMKKLYQSAELYNEVRGVHTSALSDGQDLGIGGSRCGPTQYHRPFVGQSPQARHPHQRPYFAGLRSHQF